jgi:anti-sigma factor RsiW
VKAPVTCASGVERLMDYFEDALPAAERAAIDAHVSGCERCRAFVASYLATPGIVRQATEVAAPPGLESSLLQFLRSRRR